MDILNDQIESAIAHKFSSAKSYKEWMEIAEIHRKFLLQNPNRFISDIIILAEKIQKIDNRMLLSIISEIINCLDIKFGLFELKYPIKDKTYKNLVFDDKTTFPPKAMTTEELLEYFNQSDKDSLVPASAPLPASKKI